MATVEQLKSMVNLLHKAEGNLCRVGMTVTSAMCEAREAERDDLFHYLAAQVDSLGDMADQLAERAYVLLDELCAAEDSQRKRG